MASCPVVARLRLAVVYVDGAVISGVAVLTKARVTTAECRKKIADEIELKHCAGKDEDEASFAEI